MSEHPQNGEQKENRNHGQRIGGIVRSALQSGDLSRLSELGPAVEDVVKDIPGALSTAGDQSTTRRNTNVNVNRADSPPPQQRPQRPYQAQPQYRYQPQPQQPWRGSGQVRKAGSGVPTGIVPIVFGVLGMVAFGLGSLVFAGLALAAGAVANFWPLCAGFGAAFFGSGGLLASGLGKNKLAGRVKQYYALLDKKPVYTYPELAAAVGREPAAIRKDIKKAQKKGLMPDVRTDIGDTCIIRGKEAYQLYLDSEKSREQREAEEVERQRRLSNPETADLEYFRSEGIETIRKIRSANEAIPGEEISEKLSRLEGTTARIFTYVEKYPDKLPETRRLMNYYLPTTLKLVEKYQQYEEMDFQPENVKQAKRDIEKTLDTIDEAFNNLLESLFQHDTLDVVTDIEVLERMLEQEGLTGRHFEIGPDASAGSRSEVEPDTPTLTLDPPQEP